jgi:hypothetical protein
MIGAGGLLSEILHLFAVSVYGTRVDWPVTEQSSAQGRGGVQREEEK